MAFGNAVGQGFNNPSEIITNKVIIEGSGQGIFVYNGTPAKGTLIASIAGMAGTDPYGNVYGQGSNFGVWSASTGLQEQHFGIDANGNLYLADNTGTTRIFLNPAETVLAIGSNPLAGASSITLAEASGSIASTAFPAGIALSALPFLVYSGTPAAGNLIASIAPVSGTDVFGNAYEPGFASYASFGSAVLDGAVLEFGPNGFVLPASITGQVAGQLVMTSPTTSGSDFAAELILYSSLEAPSGVPQVTISGAAELVDTTTPAKVTGSAGLFANDGLLDVVSGNDGNVYSTGSLRINIPQQTIGGSTATLASAPVAAMQYRFNACVFYANAVAAGPPEFELTGPATSQCNYMFRNNSIAAGTITPTGAIETGLSVAFGGGNANTASQCMEVFGTVTFTAAGTFALTGAEHTAGDTITVQPSSFVLEPVG